MPYKIQHQRTLVDKLAALEKEVRERSKKEKQKEEQEADAPIINPGGFGSRLMLTQGNGIAGQAPPPPMNGATGMAFGVPPQMTGFGAF